jgi:hypothetical protein
VGLTAAATEFEDDVDGGPRGRRCRWVWQWLPPSFEDDIDGRPLGGVADGSSSVHH